MNLLGLLPDALKVLGKALGIGVLTDAGNAIASASLNPDQQIAMQKALQDHETQLAQINLDAFKTAMSESLAEIQSGDKFVSRARPTGLYIYYVVCLAIIGALIAGIKLDATAILTIVAPLAGTGGFYIYNRTQEKVAGVPSDQPATGK